MEEATVVVAAIALAAWVLAPMKARRRVALPIADGLLSDLVDTKQSVYRSLIDLDMDYEQGKIAHEDYDRLRQEGKKEALALLRAMEGVEERSGGELALEDEIRAARARLRRE